jgi:flagellum-specific ATP synthase
LASRAHWPAIDVLESISRLMPDVTTRPHQDAAQTMRELMSAYRDHEDLISIGAYRRGANRLVDLSIDMLEEINKFLRQRIDEPVTLQAAQEAMTSLHHKAMAKASAGIKANEPAIRGQESAH